MNKLELTRLITREISSVSDYFGLAKPINLTLEWKDDECIILFNTQWSNEIVTMLVKTDMTVIQVKAIIINGFISTLNCMYNSQ